MIKFSAYLRKRLVSLLPRNLSAESVARKVSISGRFMPVLMGLLLTTAIVQQSVFAQSQSDNSSATQLQASAQFRSDAWYLPDEELLGFVEIPAGSFLMGSDPANDRMAFENERWSAQQRQGRVELPTYYIGRYEVTIAQYKAFLDASAYPADPIVLSSPANHPVTSVSWTDALAYGRWLERTLKESAATPDLLKELLQQGWRITLPNEAQWEKAARGFGNRIYPWGNQPSRERANFESTGIMPVGRFNCPECAYGLADMSGNVWELTISPFKPYPFATAIDRSNLDTDALWVMRGGSFSDGANLVRAAVRGGVDPGARRPNIGFRLVLTPTL